MLVKFSAACLSFWHHSSHKDVWPVSPLTECVPATHCPRVCLLSAGTHCCTQCPADHRQNLLEFFFFSLSFFFNRTLKMSYWFLWLFASIGVKQSLWLISLIVASAAVQVGTSEGPVVYCTGVDSFYCWYPQSSNSLFFLFSQT